MSRELSKVVENAAELRKIDPKHERYRAYTFYDPKYPERKAYTFARNPQAAMDLLARHFGIAAKPYNPLTQAIDWREAWSRMSPEERKRAMDEMSAQMDAAGR